MTSNIFANNAPKYTTLSWLIFPLAEGEKIPKNILSVAGNVLGKTVGPAAQTALHQGAAHADRLALGVTAPVLAQIAASKPTDPTLAHAFDSGLALRLGQHLQGRLQAVGKPTPPPALPAGHPAARWAAHYAAQARPALVAPSVVQRRERLHRARSEHERKKQELAAAVAAARASGDQVRWRREYERFEAERREFEQLERELVVAVQAPSYGPYPTEMT